MESFSLTRRHNLPAYQNEAGAQKGYSDTIALCSAKLVGEGLADE